MATADSRKGTHSSPRVVVTGANGMLGQAVVATFKGSFEVIALTREDCDLTEADLTVQAFQDLKPNHIVHCAAYTDVDGCEQRPREAQRNNADATRHVCLAAVEHQASLCYISTDYVFDGTRKEGYLESDPTGPINAYGRSKLLGEEQVRSLVERHRIVRTSWVFGPGGKNFVRTMLQLIQTRPVVRVVDDQLGSPTYTRDLAGALLALLGSSCYGTFHVTNQGQCSWFELATAIRALQDTGGRVESCLSQEFPRPAPRPRYSILRNDHFANSGFVPLRPWAQALEAYSNEVSREEPI